MSVKTKKIIVLLITIIIATAIYIWFYPLNKGDLIINSNMPDYSITANKTNKTCKQNICTIKLQAGQHILNIQKTGYFPESSNILIKRWGKENINIKFKKIPSVEKILNIPKIQSKPKKTIPNILADYSLLSPVWNISESMIAFIDKKDNKLKIWDAVNGIRQVTILNNVGDKFKLIWSLNSKYLFGNEDKDIYFIDILRAGRKKDILSFNPKNIILPVTGDYLFLNDDKNNLYKIDFVSRKIEDLKTAVNLQNAVWDKYGKLIFFIYSKTDKQTTIKYFDLAAKSSGIISYMSGYEFEKIAKDDKGIIYLYNTGDKMWYKLDY